MRAAAGSKASCRQFLRQDCNATLQYANIANCTVVIKCSDADAQCGARHHLLGTLNPWLRSWQPPSLTVRVRGTLPAHPPHPTPPLCAGTGWVSGTRHTDQDFEEAVKLATQLEVGLPAACLAGCVPSRMPAWPPGRPPSCVAACSWLETVGCLASRHRHAAKAPGLGKLGLAGHAVQCS